MNTLKKIPLLSVFLMVHTIAGAGPADSSFADTISMDQIIAYMDSVQGTLDFKTGTITIGDDLATIQVPDSFRFLSATDAQWLLSDLWNNPKDESVLGMLVRANTYVVSDACWGIVYSFDEDGYVKDDDAEKIDYDDLLKEMQDGANEANAERIKEGYDPIHLIGWAQKPFYDKTSHKLHWAKELQFGTDSLHTLNYNIRALGRKGVLVMNVVASMDQLPDVQQHMPQILASSDFNSGNRYQDYNASVDKIAEYGMGGLIAGTVLAKTGLLAKLGLILLKAWKVIAIGAVAAAGAIKKFFFGKKKTEF